MAVRVWQTNTSVFIHQETASRNQNLHDSWQLLERISSHPNKASYHHIFYRGLKDPASTIHIIALASMRYWPRTTSYHRRALTTTPPASLSSKSRCPSHSPLTSAGTSPSVATTMQSSTTNPSSGSMPCSSESLQRQAWHNCTWAS